MDPEAILQVGEAFLAKHNIKGAKILHMFVTGSVSYGLSHDNSDLDYLGVYVVNTTDMFRFPVTIQYALGDGGEKPDCQMKEASKLCELIVKGNYTIMEALFLPEDYTMQYCSEEWLELVAMREKFLTQQVLRQYLGYVAGTVGEIKRGARAKRYLTPKSWYHMFRLMNEAERVLDGGIPLTRVSEDEREFLISIREGKIPTPELLEQAQARYKELKARVDADKSRVERLDSAILDEWLSKLRWKMLPERPTPSGEDQCIV